MKMKHNPLNGWVLLLVATAMAAPTLASGQVSLATVVDLAQHNSSTVRLAEADLKKAQAGLAQTRDVFVPSMDLASGIPAIPAVGFTGGVPSIISASVQSLVPFVNLPQKRYVDAAVLGVKAAALRLKDAREEMALEASTAYIEQDTVTTELEAARQQEAFAERLVEIEHQRADAGVDPLSDLLQARLTAAQLKLKRLHLETRSATLAKQIAMLTGLPLGSITPDHASIPEIPAVKADETPQTTKGLKAAQMLARSKQELANGDHLNGLLPQISFDAQYLRSTQILNYTDYYYAHHIPTNNFSSGFSIQIPLFDWGHRDKAKESAADALRATVEAEQAQRQNDVLIVELTGNLRELDTLAEIASLKQQIAHEQLQAVLAQLELGNGAVSGPDSTPQLTPKAEQLARIEERQKYLDSLDAGFDLAKARLNLLRALGHMQDWLGELHTK